MSVQPGLPSLLWEALGSLDQAHRTNGAGTGPMPLLGEWANMLRVLDDNGVERRELPKLLALSRRAVRSNVSGAVRRGWAQEVPAGRGMARVSLTKSGAAVAARWEQLRRDAERTWEQQVGEGAVEHIRASLAVMVAALPLEHPHYPAGYGAADARVTGGYGQDWAPVPREDRTVVAALPVSALMSQALMGFALAYEDRADVALSLSALVLRRIPPKGRPARGLGVGHGGLSALVRHGYLSSEGAPGGPVLLLTAKGRSAADAYEGHVEAVGEAWRHQLGAHVVDDVRRALEQVWRPGGGADARTDG